MRTFLPSPGAERTPPSVLVVADLVGESPPGSLRGPAWHRVPEEVSLVGGRAVAVCLSGEVPWWVRPGPLGATKVSAEVGAAAVVASGDQTRRALRGVISDPVINIYYISWFFQRIGHTPRGHPPLFS